MSAWRTGVLVVAVVSLGLGAASASAAPPTITIVRPADGLDAYQDGYIPADYSCADSDGTVVSCVGTARRFDRVDTATPGTKTFTVTATDDAGETATKTVTYSVHPVDASCRSTPLAIGGASPAVANAGTAPCGDARASALDQHDPLGYWRAGALEAQTYGSGALAAGFADIGAAGVFLGPLTGLLTVDSATSAAEASPAASGSCTSPPQLFGGSHMAAVSVPGVPYTLVGDAPMHIPLLVGDLWINQQIRTANSITQRALFLDLPGTAGDVVVGETTARLACEPLPAAP